MVCSADDGVLRSDGLKKVTDEAVIRDVTL